MVKHCIFEMSHEFLMQLLRLPDGACIDAVEAPVDRPGVLRVRLAGFGYDLRPGDVVPVVRPWFEQRDDLPGVIANWTL